MYKLITNAPNGLDVDWFRRVFFDLGPQAVDVGVDRVLVAFIAVTPDLIEQLNPAVNTPRVAGQMVQQVELPRRKVHLRFVYPDHPRFNINSQAVFFDGFFWWGLLVSP